MLTIANVRRAAASLEEEGCGVTTFLIASKLGCSSDQVWKFVRCRGLRDEIGVVADAFFPGLVYMHAADAIRLRGEYVTSKTLAKELKKAYKAVVMTLSRRPDWKRHLGLLTSWEIHRLKQERACADAVRVLFRNEQKISKAGVARVLGMDRGSISRSLKKLPDLEAFLMN